MESQKNLNPRPRSSEVPLRGGNPFPSQQPQLPPSLRLCTWFPSSKFQSPPLNRVYERATTTFYPTKAHKKGSEHVPELQINLIATSFNEKLPRYVAPDLDPEATGMDAMSHIDTSKTGNAILVYGRLSDDDAKDYEILKKALFRRYDLTEEGFRKKIWNTPPEDGESPAQFIVKLKNFLKKWMEQAGASETFAELQQLMIKEQFINVVSNALEVHLKEKAPASLDYLAKAADQYLTAHGTELSKEAKVAKKPVYRPPKQTGPSAVENPWHGPNEQVIKGTSAREVRCYRCNQLGHIASKCHLLDQSRCPRNDKKCKFCDKFGHDLPECRKLKTVKTAYLDVEKSVEEAQTPVAQVSYFCSISGPPPEMEVAKVDACIKEGKLFLENGFAVPCMNACVPSNEDSMPVTKGRVGSHIVQVLRDSGYSSVVIKQKPAEDPDPAWQDTCDQETFAVATRAQATREGKRPSPLVVPGSNLYKEVDSDEVCRLQKKDDTLKKFWTSKEERKGRQVIRFETRKQLLYRTFVHPDINHGNPVSQVMVPKPLRTQVLTLAHESTLGGPLCAKKTKEKIPREFYWPGMGADITRFCRSCDICQKTISKGRVTKVLLGKLPIIATPFKRVSVDIIGNIHLPSEKGHQFNLTMMDHASRYPDAMPLKNIDSESVAEDR
ncbi:uncharacterized protein [Palaemon carinicauda]|uniref:uncharacterized protein n=1 Tax=Palaemon carinicauda TaxID=392227 RepID=UPI0035B609CD